MEAFFLTEAPSFVEVDLENPAMWEVPLWFVIHSRPRAEKKVAEWLVRNELPHYLPLLERVRSYVSKKVVFLHPAFPGYLFARFALGQRSFVRQSGHVANVIFCKNQARLLHEMERIRQVLASGLPVEKHPYLETGAKVVVTEGKLRGLEGIIVERLGATKLVISVEMFQQAVCVEVDPRMLKPA